MERATSLKPTTSHLSLQVLFKSGQSEHFTVSQVQRFSFGETFHVKFFLGIQGFRRKTMSSLSLSFSWVTTSSYRHMCSASQTQLLLCNSPPTRLQLLSRARWGGFSPFLCLQSLHAATAQLLFIYSQSRFIFSFKALQHRNNETSSVPS